MKALKDGIYASLDVFFAPFFLVIATPIFINKLGIESYGLWVLVNSIVASLSLFNFGINETIIKYVSERKKEKDIVGQRKIFSSVVTFQLLLSLGVILLIVLLFSINQIFEIAPTSELLKTLIFATPLFFIKQIEQALFALHKSYENFEYMVKQSFISKFLFYTSQIIAVYWLGSVLTVFQLSLIVSTCYLFFQFYLLPSKYDNIFNLRHADINTFKNLFKGYGKWAWLSSTVAIVNSNIDKWLVSGILGLTVFGYYAIGVLILNQLHTIISASISWVFPKISSKQLSNSRKSLLHLKLTLFVTIVGVITSLILVKWDIFFLLWLGEDTFSDCKMYINTFLYLLPVWLLSSVSYYYLLGMGMVKNKFKTDIIVLLTKLSVIYIVLVKIDFTRWPIFYVIPILVEIILYTFIVNTKCRLKLFYLILLIALNIALLLMRFVGVV